MPAALSTATSAVYINVMQPTVILKKTIKSIMKQKATKYHSLRRQTAAIMWLKPIPMSPSTKIVFRPIYFTTIVPRRAVMKLVTPIT